MWMATRYGWFDVAAHHGRPGFVAIRSAQRAHLGAYQMRCYGEIRFEAKRIRAWGRGWWISIPKTDWLRHVQLFAQDAATETNLQTTVAAVRNEDTEYRALLKVIGHAVVGAGELHGDDPSVPIDLETGEPADVV